MWADVKWWSMSCGCDWGCLQILAFYYPHHDNYFHLASYPAFVAWTVLWTRTILIHLIKDITLWHKLGCRKTHRHAVGELSLIIALHKCVSTQVWFNALLQIHWKVYKTSGSSSCIQVPKYQLKQQHTHSWCCMGDTVSIIQYSQHTEKLSTCTNNKYQVPFSNSLGWLRNEAMQKHNIYFNPHTWLWQVWMLPSGWFDCSFFCSVRATYVVGFMQTFKKHDSTTWCL